MSDVAATLLRGLTPEAIALVEAFVTRNRKWYVKQYGAHWAEICLYADARVLGKALMGEHAP